jgi:hypothetical protein
MVPRETNALLFRAVSNWYTGQITVETLLEPLFGPFLSVTRTPAVLQEAELGSNLPASGFDLLSSSGSRLGALSLSFAFR